METPLRIEQNIMSLTTLSLFLFREKQQDIVQNSSSEIISGANFPKVMFIVFLVYVVP